MRFGTDGLSFPFRLSETGSLATSGVNLREGNVDHIKEGLLQLFGTRKGERFFRRDFGDEMGSLIFRPNSPEEVTLWASERDDVLRRWEPRVHVRAFKILQQKEHFLQFRMEFIVEGQQVSQEIGLVF